MPPRKRQKKTVTSEETEKSLTLSTQALNYDLKNKSLLDKAYGTSLPIDLLQFWEFCCEFNKGTPLNILQCLNLKLVGPFEILAKVIKPENVENSIKFHLHWRFYYDPPELMTVLVSTDPSSRSHFGYLKDDPKDEHSIVVHNSGEDYRIEVSGDNIFSTVHNEIQKKIGSAKGKQKKSLQNLFKNINEYAKDCGLSLESQSIKVKERNKRVVAKTFHGAGIVVPIDENEVGYRPLYESDVKIKKMFARIDEAENDDFRMAAFDELQEMITYIQFANDECDYGMGFELGMDMFCYGSRYLNKAANRLLTGAYSLLKRDLYKKIIEHHLADRRKENLSRLSEDT